ncbi:MAG TPA: acyl-CoA carboxylase epsilon subunit [Jatrophihabitans sp.]|jgi:hypothetical protein|nr:acyl-CoA carboxylase epsilon subunit [Jatrophihabitans sp.]
MSSADAPEHARPPLRIVRGDPSPEELAVVAALVAARAGGEESPGPRVRHGSWNDPARQLRQTPNPGPNAWRAAAW